jgi:hypothetical protein
MPHPHAENYQPAVHNEDKYKTLGRTGLKKEAHKYHDVVNKNPETSKTPLNPFAA